MELRSTILLATRIRGSRGVLHVACMRILVVGMAFWWARLALRKPWQLSGSAGKIYHLTFCEIWHWWVVLLTGHIHWCQQIGSFQIGACQYLSPKREAQLIPTSPADTSGSVSKSPLPVVSVLFNLVFLHWFSGQMSLSLWPLKVDFPFLLVL